MGKVSSGGARTSSEPTADPVLDLGEARKRLDEVLGDDLRQQYFACLRQWFLFSSSLSLEHLNMSARKLLKTDDQYRCHINFILALNLKSNSSLNRTKISRPVGDSGSFEPADFADYVPASEGRSRVPKHDYRSAADELFAPDNEFINCRVEVAAWEHDLKSVDAAISELVAHACKAFLKNIVTAMLTRAKGYKTRDGRFQYGFNAPVPDPFLRNYKNVVDESSESKVELEKDVVQPKSKRSLERAELEVAYAYAASKKVRTGVTLSKRLLFETLVESPQLLGGCGQQRVNLLKLSLSRSDYDEQMSDSETET